MVRFSKTLWRQHTICYVLTGMIWLRFLKIIIIVLPPLSLGIIDARNAFNDHNVFGMNSFTTPRERAVLANV